jgi:hypothetical protein
MWQSMTAYFIETWNHLLAPFGVEGAQLVDVLCYRLEGRWFDYGWCLVEFFIYIIFSAAKYPWGRLNP